MSFVTGTVTECLYASIAVGASLNTFTTEAQLNTTAAMGVQVHLPPDFWLPNQSQLGRGIKVIARGLLSTTATPTYTVTLRGGAAANITTAPLLLGTGAMTMATVTNAFWELEADIVLTAIGGAGANSTVRGTGKFTTQINTSTGAASVFPIWGGGASPGTVATLDNSIANYLNLNVACNASSASNIFALQQLVVFGVN